MEYKNTNCDNQSTKINCSLDVPAIPPYWEFPSLKMAENSENEIFTSRKDTFTLSPRKLIPHTKFCEIVNSFKSSLQKHNWDEQEDDVVAVSSKRMLEDVETSPVKLSKAAKLSVSSCVCHLDYGRRSPCSDNYSVVANCPSDLSDISDDDVSQFSEDEFERQFEESVQVEDIKHVNSI